MPPKPKPKKPKPLILPTPSNPTPSEFSSAVATTAVAQICHSAGYSLTRLSALETLTAVAINYLTSLAASSAAYAARANRTDANLIDFANAIHDMSSVKGFAGAAGLHRSCAVMQSGVLKELKMFVDRTVETPFAWPIPRRGEALENRVARNVGSGMRHVPRWLPGFPEVGEAKRAKRGKGEELWEMVVGENVNENVGNENVGIDGDGNRELVGMKSKRERVRFKIGGAKMKRNGVCGGGKTVGLELEFK